MADSQRRPRTAEIEVIDDGRTDSTIHTPPAGLESPSATGVNVEGAKETFHDLEKSLSNASKQNGQAQKEKDVEAQEEEEEFSLV
ncbi:hypothetical protein A4X03_0g5422, partial [Tilletia caries]